MLVVVLAIAVVGVVVIVVASPGQAPVPRVSASSSTTPTASPAEPVRALDVALGRVQGRGPKGFAKPRTLRAPAEQIRRTFADLYEAAFVDPDSWDGGRFGTIDRFFTRSARPRVRRDLDELSLGRLATKLDGVRPEDARVDVRFVIDRGGHPEVAFADMSFRGTGHAADVDVPIAQRGRYVLQRGSGGWRIESWNATAHVPSSESVEAKTRTARYAPPPPGRGPLFVLVIGSDARPGQSVTGTRGDSLHIVSVNPRLRRGAIVGIPRDSYVPIPGHGTNKINASLFYGGPDLVVRTVEQLTHVRIDGYLLTGFDGFRRVMDGIGGVDIRVPYPMDDANSGAHFERGRTHLNGREALSFSRDRHDVPGGDLGRSMDQGRVLLATLTKLRQQLAADPGRLIPWLVGAMRFLKTDLSISQMTELLLAASTFDPGRIRNAVASGSGAMAGTQSIVRLGSKAYAIFRDVARDGVIGH